MKTLLAKTLVLLAFALTSTAAFAGDEPVKEPNVYEQIRSLLSDFPNDLVEGETRISVSFMVTKSSEIVVLSTSDEEFDSYVKTSLNYQQLKNHSLKSNTVYVLPLTLREI